MLSCYYCQFHLTNNDLHQNGNPAKPDENVILFEGKQYSFLALESYEPNDVVVVETQNGLKIARVLGEAPLTKVATRYIIGLVDLQRFTEIRERNEKMRDLEEAIDQRIKTAERENLIRHLAETDPEMRKLLDALVALREQEPAPRAIAPSESTKVPEFVAPGKDA